ncbi:MAG: flagellar basal body protein, partial [Desulfobulbaceae bacterium]|nr:flagellar basal body protein [Desulfobulbaceae bacterium]
MSGISSVLNIAKEALLTHQVSVQVASHNIANVDTPGYTRQTLTLSPNLATLSNVGQIGNGVHGETIARRYDQFMTQRIMDQTSTQSNLEAQQSTMRMVETIFNEAPGMALNDMMSQFWNSIQELADNPEITAVRQQVVQQAEMI